VRRRGARGPWVVTLCVAVAALPRLAAAQSLRGSSSAVARSYSAAVALGLPFAKTAAHVEQLVEAGKLVEVKTGPSLALHQVSYPYATPALSSFVTALASRYRQACGEQMVVTSLVRPLDQQPANASEHSVHPAGSAVDIRRSKTESCLVWLERELLTLEGAGEVEATRESRPPHYHVTVLPQQQVARGRGADPATARGGGDAAASGTYQVAPNDSLWAIARRFGTTIDAIRALNRLDETQQIVAGQRLAIPPRAEGDPPTN
jgi:LysM repeat protein